MIREGWTGEKKFIENLPNRLSLTPGHNGSCLAWTKKVAGFSVFLGHSVNDRFSLPVVTVGFWWLGLEGVNWRGAFLGCLICRCSV